MTLLAYLCLVLPEGISEIVIFYSLTQFGANVSRILTCCPFSKGKAGVSRPESFTQDLPLEVNHWLQHCLVLDFSRRDHDAAVHEVSNRISQIFLSLGEVSFQTEHLDEKYL